MGIEEAKGGQVAEMQADDMHHEQEHQLNTVEHPINRLKQSGKGKQDDWPTITAPQPPTITVPPMGKALSSKEIQGLPLRNKGLVEGEPVTFSYLPPARRWEVGKYGSKGDKSREERNEDKKESKNEEYEDVKEADDEDDEDIKKTKEDDD